MICDFILVCPALQRYEAETHIPRTDGGTERHAKKVYNTVPRTAKTKHPKRTASRQRVCSLKKRNIENWP